MLLASLSPSLALDKASVFATAEEGFGRIVLSFPDRHDLPPYKLKSENGVLSITFEGPVSLLLPDVAATLPGYVTIARVDPDSEGVRFGLRSTFSFASVEAGERLFIHLLPPSWQGLPPALPPEIVAELAQRAEDAAKLAEQKRLADEALRRQPVATVRVGRNPTFTRLQFDWSVETEGEFALEGAAGLLRFSWPVDIDLTALGPELPPQLLEATSITEPDGALVSMVFADGVEPRFYQTSATQFVIDIDTGVPTDMVPLEALGGAETEAGHQPEESHDGGELALPVEAIYPAEAAAEVPAYVNVIGDTVRLVFPFDQDTPAAAFRRGDVMWLLFDTRTTIQPPPDTPELRAAAPAVTFSDLGDAQVVRVEVNNRLATVASEGRAWVLSLGDILLEAPEPLVLVRQEGGEGGLELSADLMRPGRVHAFRDPDVGDILQVVTAFPPGRGLDRTLRFAEFAALPTSQGLVVQMLDDAVEVGVAGHLALVRRSDGLALSPVTARRGGLGLPDAERHAFLDLNDLYQPAASLTAERAEQLAAQTAVAEGEALDRARLELAHFFIANDFGYEALGVLRLIAAGDMDAELRKKVTLATAVAQVLAHRPGEALPVLSSQTFGEQPDAALWRTIAGSDTEDFAQARADAMAAEGVLTDYPLWLREKFLFSAVRAGVETGDVALATRLLGELDPRTLSGEPLAEYTLLLGRLREAEGATELALELYGDVIAADIRPQRAEAVFRTVLLLHESGGMDVDKAVATLGAEALLWRGNTLEAKMQRLLAEMFFGAGQYRLGFEVARQAAATYPESPPVDALTSEAQAQFERLFLDGGADALEPIDALALFYDFRQLTPPGTRGDSMIRNLARRLVKVDLLTQAAELLQYQVDDRLSGIGAAQVATELALIQIADRNPEGALRTLSQSRLAELPPSLEHQRRILEARALVDAGRGDLALDLLSRLDGREADLLRIDAHWAAKRYDTAAGMIEILYEGELGGAPLNETARMGVVRAAVGFVLADDRMGLARLRAKFGDAMADAPEWAMFDFVTSVAAPTGTEFRQVANAVAGLDSLNAFLASYRELYGAADGLAPSAAPSTAGV